MRLNTLTRWCAAGAIACTAVVGMVSATASAQTSADPSPPPITDYDTYPDGILPDTCTAEGAAVVVNPMFSVDGGPETANLASLDLEPPATSVSMTWDGFAPGCEGAGVSLSGKISGAPYFDPNIDQRKDRSAYCGPGEGMIPCEAPYRLTLSLVEEPGQPDIPCFQIDAHLGPALDVVGPSGSYYRFNNPGGRDMLIGAWNGGREPCTVPVTVTTLQPPPTTTPTTAPSSTTTPPTTPTSTPTSVSVLPTRASIATTAPPTTCANGESMNANGECVAVAGVSATIPRTGSTSTTTAGAGVVMVLVGSALVVTAGTLGRHRRQL